MTQDKQHLYYEAIAQRNGLYSFKVYHYDEFGNREVVIKMGGEFLNRNDALDAAVEWLEENHLDAEWND